MFLADTTEPGAWNLPLYKMFADPFTTPGLIIDPHMHDGFLFEVDDHFEERRLVLDLPSELYDLFLFVGAPARYMVHRVVCTTLGETAAAAGTQRLSLIAGRYVGKDHPVMARGMFADPSFGRARTRADEVMDYVRAHGPFEPHRLPLDDMEYTTMPAVAARLTDRWEPFGPEAPATVPAPLPAPATARAG